MAGHTTWFDHLCYPSLSDNCVSHEKFGRIRTPGKLGCQQLRSVTASKQLSSPSPRPLPLGLLCQHQLPPSQSHTFWRTMNTKSGAVPFRTDFVDHYAYRSCITLLHCIANDSVDGKTISPAITVTCVGWHFCRKIFDLT